MRDYADYFTKIGRFFYDMESYEDALFSFSLAHELYEKIEDKESLQYSGFNLAITYHFGYKDFNKALTYYTAAEKGLFKIKGGKVTIDSTFDEVSFFDEASSDRLEEAYELLKLKAEVLESLDKQAEAALALERAFPIYLKLGGTENIVEPEG